MSKAPSRDTGSGDDPSPELLAELRAAAALPDDQINTDDVPEVGDWTGAVQGRFYRPIKRQVTLRLDADVLAFFKATETHYQTAMNQILRAAMLRGLESGQKATMRGEKPATQD